MLAYYCQSAENGHHCIWQFWSWVNSIAKTIKNGRTFILPIWILEILLMALNEWNAEQLAIRIGQPYFCVGY